MTSRSMRFVVCGEGVGSPRVSNVGWSLSWRFTRLILCWPATTAEFAGRKAAILGSKILVPLAWAVTVDLSQQEFLAEIGVFLLNPLVVR